MCMHAANVSVLVDEYSAILHTVIARDGTDAVVNWHAIVERLELEADWTCEGAITLARLVKDYGSFVLRNALALALAVGVEDGELGL